MLGLFCSAVLTTVVCSSPSASTCSVAMATMSGDVSLSGFASVDQDGMFTLNLDVSDLDASSCADDGVGGFKYHIHNKWTHGDDDVRLGAAYCGADFTGMHPNLSFCISEIRFS